MSPSSRCTRAKRLVTIVHFVSGMYLKYVFSLLACKLNQSINFVIFFVICNEVKSKKFQHALSCLLAPYHAGIWMCSRDKI